MDILMRAPDLVEDVCKRIVKDCQNARLKKRSKARPCRKKKR